MVILWSNMSELTGSEGQFIAGQRAAGVVHSHHPHLVHLVGLQLLQDTVALLHGHTILLWHNCGQRQPKPVDILTSPPWNIWPPFPWLSFAFTSVRVLHAVDLKAVYDITRADPPVNGDAGAGGWAHLLGLQHRALRNWGTQQKVIISFWTVGGGVSDISNPPGTPLRARWELDVLPLA